MLTVQEYLQGLAITGATIVAGVLSVLACYRVIRFTHYHRPR